MKQSLAYLPPNLALDPWLGWLLVGLVVVPLFLGLLLQSRRNPRLAFGLLFALLWTAAVGVGWWQIRQRGLPPQWITVLQEGCSDRSVLQLYLSAINIGPLHGWLAQQTSTLPKPHLPQFVAAQLALTVATIGWFAALLAVRLRSVFVAGLLTACLALAPQVLDAALSEHAGPLGMAMVVAGLAAVAAARGAQHPAERWLAVTASLALVVLAAQVRVEWLVGALPVAVDVLAEVWPPLRRTLDSVWAAAVAVVPRVVAWVARHGGWAVGAVVVWSVLVQFLGTRPRWAVLAVVPVSDWIEIVPLWLVSLPMAAGAALLLGLYARWQHPTRRPWGLLAGVPLLAVYHSACIGIFQEWLRYTSVYVPILLWLAGIGWLQVRRWASHYAWPQGWRWVAAVLVLLVTNPVTTDPWLVPRLGNARTEYDLPPRPTDGTNQQEVRWLWQQTLAAPHCLLVSRVAKSGQPHHFHHVVYGWTLRFPVFVQTPPGSALHAAREVVATAPCIRYVRSWDCSRDAAGCDRDHASGKLLTHNRLSAQLYSDPIGYGLRDGVADVSVYELYTAWQSPLWLAPPVSGPDQVAWQGDPSAP